MISNKVSVIEEISFFVFQIYRVYGNNQEIETVRLTDTLSCFGDDSKASKSLPILFVIYHDRGGFKNCYWWQESDCRINSLAPGKFDWNFRYVIFKRILVIDGWGICCEIVLVWMSLDFTDDQSTLVQVMAPSHYLSQCWPRSLSPFDITRPLWFNFFILFDL